MENDIDILVKRLTNILRNFRKSPNRRYQKNTLLIKASESHEIYNRLLENLEDHPSGKLILSRTAKLKYL